MGIAGFGAIGWAAAFAAESGIAGLRLGAIGARDTGKVRAALPPGLAPVIVEVTASAEHADIVVERAPAALLPAIAEPALRAGRTLVAPW